MHNSQPDIIKRFDNNRIDNQMAHFVHVHFKFFFMCLCAFIKQINLVEILLERAVKNEVD